MLRRYGETIRKNILNSASEAIGTRTISINRMTNTNPWFLEEVEERATRIQQQYDKYKLIRNRVKKKYQISKEIVGKNITKTKNGKCLSRKIKMQTNENFTLSVFRL